MSLALELKRSILPFTMPSMFQAEMVLSGMGTKEARGTRANGSVDALKAKATGFDLVVYSLLVSGRLLLSSHFSQPSHFIFTGQVAVGAVHSEAKPRG